LTRILPPGQRPRPADAATVAEPPSTPIRLLIGPANSAGQGWQWARAVEREIEGVGATAMRVVLDTDLGHPADLSVPLGTYRWSHRWRRAQEDAVAGRFTHVLLESARPLLSDVSSVVVAEIRRLRENGIAVGLLFHGSDLRLPDRHARREPLSPYTGNRWELTATLQAQAERSAALIARLRLPVFVSTPDLLLDAPSAHWLPVVIDPDAWAGGRTLLAGGDTPIVAHAPSHPLLKGSDLIDPVLRRLDDEGTIRYRRLEGVPAHRMAEAYRDADIVLDQFRLGYYGVAACEAMAAGRIVLGHVSEAARSTVAQRTGLELPIVEAMPDDLEATVRTIVSHRERYRKNGEDGRAFVTAVHDGRFAAEVLRPFLTPAQDPGRNR
jgi:hypothetical protein